MNFDRISFRTNEKERQFLTRLNQRYQCKSITTLMHKFIADAIAKHGSEEQKVSQVFGDFHIELPSGKHEEATILERQKAAAAATLQKSPDIETVLNSIERSMPKVENESVSDPFELFLKDISDLERLRDAIYRSLPYRQPNWSKS